VDIVKKIADLAKRIFLKDGYHAPMLFVKGTKYSEAIQLATLGETAAERELDMFKVGTWLARKHHVGDLELIVFVCEGWLGKNINILPSLDPKRIEALLINSLDARTQEQNLLQFEIKRDPKGNVLDLKETVFPGTVETKGKLLPAFLEGYKLISPVHN
jgi:hypothetical protein